MGRVFGTELSATWRKDIRFNQYFFGADELAQIQRKFVRTDHDQLISGSAGASWQVWEGGTVSGTLVYGSGLRKGFANSETGTPYLTANLGVAQSFQLPDGGTWTARLDVVNLFDRVYTLRDGTGIGAAQYGIRRGVFAGLSRAI